MAGELATAAEVLNARKRAVIGDDAADLHRLDAGAYLGLLSGFDLDPEELASFERLVARHGLTMCVADGAPVVNVLASCFVDGLALGLLIAQARERAAAEASR